jgi:putative ABC transport system permease protein
VDALVQDVRYAIRQFLKFPGFTILAVLTLALGIGANTAMFTIIDSVMVRSLPYANAGRLVSIGPEGTAAADSAFTSTSWLNYRDIRDRSQTLADAAGYSEDVGVVQGKDGSTSVVMPGVTPNLFSLLGAKPLLGRTFSEDEGKTGGPSVVLLSENLWRESFGGDPGIIGRTIRVNAKPRTVVGIMPHNFRFPDLVGSDLEKGLWVPIQPNSEMLKERGYSFFYIVGSLKPGVRLDRFQSELSAIAQRIRESDPKATQTIKFVGTPYQQALTGDVRPVFLGLVAALGLVLLIACANVANLLIARCLGRQQEFAVRAALGAGRFRLMRQLVVEGGLLSAAGALVGLCLAELAVSAVHKLPADTIPRGADIAVHWNIILILAGIATLTTVLCSLFPAWIVSRTDPQPALQAASRAVGSHSVRRSLSGALVAVEVALSTLLLISAGLLFRTLWNLDHARLGFELERVTSFTAVPADAAGFSNMTVGEEGAPSAPSIATLVYQPAIQRMQSLPGFEDAALITAPPLSGIDMNSSFEIVGRAKDQQRGNHTRLSAVSGGYAHVMRTPVLRGRMIGEDDTAAFPFVLVVNEALVKEYFPNEDPLGKQLDFGGKDTGMLKPYTIVGVLGNQVDKSVSLPSLPAALLPYQQIPTTSIFYAALLKTVVNFVVKTRADVPVAPEVHSAFRQIAPDLALDNFHTMRENVDQNNFNQRLGLYVIGAFAGMAVLMVVAGLYGVLAQLVGYRRREIGIRLALGATRQSILTMILRQGSLLMIAGLAAGLALATLGGKLVKGFLYGVKPLDISTYLAVMILLLTSGLVAALVPARRAAAVEPTRALRDE